MEIRTDYFVVVLARKTSLFPLILGSAINLSDPIPTQRQLTIPRPFVLDLHMHILKYIKALELGPFFGTF